MAQVTEQQILAALEGVVDPDRGQDIVSLDMVSGLIVKDGNVGFAIEVDPKRGGQLEPLRKAGADLEGSRSPLREGRRPDPLLAGSDAHHESDHPAGHHRPDPGKYPRA